MRRPDWLRTNRPKPRRYGDKREARKLRAFKLAAAASYEWSR